MPRSARLGPYEILAAIGAGGMGEVYRPRAYAMDSDTAKARAAYQVFLTLWKSADPDLPVLKAATAAYARLH